MENCEFCNSPAHNWIYCPKKPDGWRPARLAKKSTAALEAEVLGRQESASLVLKHGKRTKAVSNGRSSALPVDTMGVPASRQALNAGYEAYAPAKFSSVGDGASVTKACALAGVAPEADRQPKRGRPRIHPDRKAYKAMKEREYRKRRAKQKEEGK